MELSQNEGGSVYVPSYRNPHCKKPFAKGNPKCLEASVTEDYNILGSVLGQPKTLNHVAQVWNPET